MADERAEAETEPLSSMNLLAFETGEPSKADEREGEDGEEQEGGKLAGLMSETEDEEGLSDEGEVETEEGEEETGGGTDSRRVRKRIEKLTHRLRQAERDKTTSEGRVSEMTTELGLNTQVQEILTMYSGFDNPVKEVRFNHHFTQIADDLAKEDTAGAAFVQKVIARMKEKPVSFQTPNPVVISGQEKTSAAKGSETKASQAELRLVRREVQDVLKQERVRVELHKQILREVPKALVGSDAEIDEDSILTGIKTFADEQGWPLKFLIDKGAPAARSARPPTGGRRAGAAASGRSEGKKGKETSDARWGR